MIGPVSPACFPCGEVPKYRKKSAKKPPKKANHKHTYERVIFRYLNPQCFFYPEYGFVGDYSYSAGSRCTVCGRLEHGFPGDGGVCVSQTVRMPRFNEPDRKRNILKPEYVSLPIVEVEDYWKLKEVKPNE